jgi:hypothetical protein
MSSVVALFGKHHLSGSNSSIASSSIRWLATSAQKRKWKATKKTSPKSNSQVSLVENNNEKVSITKADEIREKGVNWRPILFLGIFPIVMSGLVIFLREDLRKEVEEKGVGRALRDFKSWRTQRALDYERKLRENALQEANQKPASS